MNGVAIANSQKVILMIIATSHTWLFWLIILDKTLLYNK